LAALVVAIMPAAVSAVTLSPIPPGSPTGINVGQVATGSFAEPGSGPGGVAFGIQALEDMQVMVVGTALPTLFDLSLTSNQGPLDIQPGLMGSTTFAQMVSLAASEILTITFGWTDAVGGGGQVTFTAVAPPPPIPLPAAGWMLISALGGMAVLARRRKAVA
jgi:hypothetical protein